jgi:hypothetical protein
VRFLIESSSEIESSLLRYSYRAYGLNLASNLPLEGLGAAETDAPKHDLVLELGFEPDWARAARRWPASLRHSSPAIAEMADPALCLTARGADQFFELAYSDGTHFVVDAQANRLCGTWLPPLTIEDFATYLLGPVMGFVLRQRNILALHASSASIGGQAVVLCGESEAGKSTTAAALALAGISILAEDISPLNEQAGILYVEPGYPRICLWPSAVDTLFGTPDALPPLTPTWEKRFLALDGVQAKFEPQRQPLGAVYLLAPRADEAHLPRVEGLGKREALLQLVQNTYMNWLLDRAQRAAELDVLARIVAQVPVRRIVPHSDPARLGALAELIVTDAERLFTCRESAALLPAR